MIHHLLSVLEIYVLILYEVDDNEIHIHDVIDEKLYSEVLKYYDDVEHEYARLVHLIWHEITDEQVLIHDDLYVVQKAIYLDEVDDELDELDEMQTQAYDETDDHEKELELEHFDDDDEVELIDETSDDELQVNDECDDDENDDVLDILLIVLVVSDVLLLIIDDDEVEVEDYEHVDEIDLDEL